MPNFRELELPGTLVAEEDEGFEVVRFWIGGGNEHVALSLLNNDEGAPDISAWGKIAADIVKHAIRALKQDDVLLDDSEILATIERAFHERLRETTNFSGQLVGKVQ